MAKMKRITATIEGEHKVLWGKVITESFQRGQIVEERALVTVDGESVEGWVSELGLDFESRIRITVETLE